MKYILTTIILALLAQPALAKTVYYCTTLRAVTMDGNGGIEHPLERFKMMVDNQQLHLIGGSLFPKGLHFNLEIAKNGVLHARWDGHLEDGTTITMGMAHFQTRSRILTSTITDTFQVSSIFAECDKF